MATTFSNADPGYIPPNTRPGTTFTNGDPGVISTPPPKADSAVAATNNTYASLVSALNASEAKLVADKKFNVPNTYSIEFAPASLADSKVAKPGTKSKAATPMTAKTGVNQVNQKSQSIDYATRTFEFAAGTPIVLIIDEILKNSSYVTSQAKAVLDEITNDVIVQNNLGNLVWYKISTEATPKEPFDTARQGYAYNIKYIISSYAVNSMDSEFFRQAVQRGVHKSYKYWFTGQNTQVLKFEQKFNHLYNTTVVEPRLLNGAAEKSKNIIARREYQAAVAGSSNQGAKGKTNAVGASAADYFYSLTDIGETEITIIGDPAWLQQGESSVGINTKNFNFGPFNADGGINFDAQQIVFDIQFNPGVDYDADGTGLANPNTTTDPLVSYTYIAKTVKSRFNKGRFEQDITGSLFQDPSSVKKATDTDKDTGRDPRSRFDTVGSGTRIGTGAGDEAAAQSAILSRQAIDNAALARTNFAATDPRLINNNPLPVSVTPDINAQDPEAQVFVPSFNPPPPLPVYGESPTNADDPEAQLFERQLIAKDE